MIDTDTVRLIETEIVPRSDSSRRELMTDIGSKKQMAEKMVVPRRKIIWWIKAAIAVSVLTTILVVVRLHYFMGEENTLDFSSFFAPSSTSYNLGDALRLDLKQKTLTISEKSTGKSLDVKFISDAINSSPDSKSCAELLKNDEKTNSSSDRLKLIFGIDPYVNTRCMKWKHTLLIVNDTHTKESLCYSVRWETTDKTSTPKNCFSLYGGYWYGGSLLANQQWPLADNSFNMQPYVSSRLDIFKPETQSGFGPVLERMWISTTGFAVVADSEDPIHISLNEDKLQLCLKSQYDGSSYVKTDELRPLSLKYTICMDRKASQVHRTVMKNFVQLPKSGPDEYLMQNPVWSTRGINVRNLTQTQVLSQQIDIKKHLFLHSRFLISSGYMRTVGSVYFDHERFPNAEQMVSEMKSNGFNVSYTMLPVVERGKYPFEFDEGVKAGVFVNVTGLQSEIVGGNVYNLSWDNKSVVLVDFTNPKAVEWMTKRFEGRKLEMPTHAFHFDGGEATLLAKTRQTHIPLPNPNSYSTHYVKFAHSLGTDSVVSVGYQSQQYGLMVDIGPRLSSWGYDLGLQSIIPSVLTMGLMGYPFVMVGPVGGVPVGRFDKARNQFEFPEPGLYVRWLQLAIFLPGIEMSVGPWQYNDKEIVDIAHALFKRRAEEILPLLQTAEKEFLHTGAPIIRPVWWMAYDDETAQRIDCEFMVSNKLLVAPILNEGQLQRSVYLPKVKNLKWYDNLRSEILDGGQWIHGYKVGLNEVATFKPVLPSARAT